MQNQLTFSVYNTQYVTVVLATLFNLEYCILRPCITTVVCFLSYIIMQPRCFSCLIFKCTIFKCPLCSLHEMTWIYYYYFFECWKLYEQNRKKKKYHLFKRDHLESGSSVFVCVCVCFCFLSVIFFFSFLLGSGGRVRKPRQHSCIISAIT